ncbi:HmuY family protein [Cupriavidus numazuensis]|uniref:Heme-binding HmuY-like protein n=1 Tax=Cupriavidus numazuensis TaxID=221992 RepID=A0ABN7Q6A9_9BURK|nr:HmuY family protein [Cupriavidus numazuensis]CAG2158546.1 hypothetical protein LMG26411_06043 [Cupriavidus numazuensis]
MTRISASTLGAIMMALALAACGGGGDDTGSSNSGNSGNSGNNGNSGNTGTTSAFTQSAKWTFALPASGSTVCYDFNAKAEVANCSGNAWDLKVKSSGMTGSLWTNSGTSGSGGGGAFGGPFDHTWAELQTWQNATTDPKSGAIPSTLFFKDSASGVFSGTNDIASAAFEYGVGGANDHLLYPNFRTFVITTDSTKLDPVGSASSPVYALQVTGYYGGAGGTTSGNPSFRWVDRSDVSQTVRTATVNASADWVYYDLQAGAVSTASGTWHIAFNRYNFKLNGGESGSGKVAGYVGKTPAGFYDADKKPVASKFTDSSNLVATAADLTSTLDVPATVSAWVKDGTSSPLGPKSTGTYPNPLNYGWYTYYPTTTAAAAAGLPSVAHLIKANVDSASLLRGGEGNTYARFHVTQIAYADPNNASSQQTWTIEFDVQP